MATLLFGDRIGKTAKLSPAVRGFIFNQDRTQLLLVRRNDNHRWCVPGGRIEPGESIGETAIREIREETGLETTVRRLLGAWSDPNIIFTYPDGNRWQGIEIDLELEVVAGITVPITGETEELAYFSLSQMKEIDLMEVDVDHIHAMLDGWIIPYCK